MPLATLCSKGGRVLFDIVNTFSIYPLNVMGAVNVYVHVCMCIYRQACTCVHACRGQRLTLAIFLNRQPSSNFFLGFLFKSLIS